ncbi:MATE family efflux transporter [Flavobacterium agricola]|uniref:Multidrug-efflux transporter n=1 Tax=Flavobacterium agricola TaxID=2870839 RepID=A0ABY6LVV0_9FLAO|nr:MATE family efflux transporter [Flavobacterium agricola]UYW00356.1 MATE family efflux transporter [Flavobacterium agricola]
MNLSIYTREFKRNIQLAYPIVLGMLGHNLVSLVDNIMVGHLGATQLAAVSLANSFVFIALSVGIGFSTAITPLVAQHDAKHDIEGVRNTFHHGVVLCATLGLVLFSVIFFGKGAINYMRQPQEVVEMAKPFLDIVAFSLIPVVMFQGYKQFSDGMSFTKYAMYAIIICNIVHFLINLVLINGFLFFPEMGVMGAAYGTLISRIVMVVYMHIQLKNNNKLSIYFKQFSFKKMQKSVINRICALGLPSSLQMFFEVALFVSAVWLCGMIGKNEQAANQIALNLVSATYMFASGLSITAMIRVGNQKGLEDFNYLKTVARSIFLLALILEVIFALFFIFMNGVLPYIFLDMAAPETLAENTQVFKIASSLLVVAALFQLSDGIQAVVLGALRGLQDVKVPAVVAFIAYWIIGFPISVYLGLYTNLGAVGVWIGLSFGLTVAAILLYLRFKRLTNKYITENTQTI